MAEESSQPEGRERLAILVALGAAAFATVVCWVLAAWDSVDGTIVVALRPSVKEALYTSAMAAMGSPLLLAAVAFARGRATLGVLCLLSVPALYAASFITSTFVNPAPYRFSSRTVAADGEAYLFGETSFMQGELLGIYQEVEAGYFTVTGRRVILSKGDSQTTSARVVRPAQDVRQDRYQQLYTSPDRSIIVANRYDNCAQLAIDTATETGWTHTAAGRDGSSGTRPIHALSPFVLIGPDDELYSKDVEDLLEPSNACGPSDASNLSEVVLEEALRHPNHRVRDLARELGARRGG